MREVKISPILKDLMRSHDIGPTKLARVLGVKYGRVKSWLERGAPKVDNELYKCAEFFKVPLSYLLFGEWRESYETRDITTVIKMTQEETVH